MPPGGLNIRWPDPPLEAEKRLFGPKMEAVKAFARANRLDRIVLDGKPARLGIITTGKAYLDLRQALADLGISDRDAEALGLRIYKVAMTWPLEESGARRFAEGLQDVLVVEEKRGFIEDQLMRILYNVDASKRPSVVGKRDESGATLLPSEGELNPTVVAAALVARLRRLGHQSPVLEQRLARLEAFDQPATGQARDHAAADAVLLLGLSAQHLDQIAGRQPRHGRHRLPRHGAVDPLAPHRDHHPYGRRRRELDRTGALHQRAAHLPESRRRHLYPFGPARAARRGRQRRQHHLQDPL